MKKTIAGIVWIALLLSLTLTGCQASNQAEQNNDVLFQYSTLGSLMAGVFDGEMTFAALKEQGDFGLGTFNTLDGEMIEIDHKFYQVKSDGIAYPVSDDMKTPFSVVTFFEADQTVTVEESLDCDQLKAYIDSLLPTENIPYAVKVTGTFSYMKTRSVPSQVEPYPRLLDVLADQPTFEFQSIDGVMLGFRLPEYMDVANSPGYHFHFINDARDAGGHVLGCQVQKVTVEVDYTDTWYTVLPDDQAFYNVDMSDEQYQ